MTTFFARSTGNALVPHSKAAALEMDALPRGVPLRVEATQPRNGKQHRLFWAFASYVAHALNDGPVAAAWTAEGVVDMLKIATGHVDMVKLAPKDAKRLGVDMVAMPRSISFAKMDGAEFSRLMNAAFGYVRDDLCTWISASPYWREIEIILSESRMIEPAAAMQEAEHAARAQEE